jgi:hypothetical protein
MLETFAGFLMFGASHHCLHPSSSAIIDQCCWLCGVCCCVGLYLHSRGFEASDWLLVFNQWNTNDPNLQDVVARGQSIFFVTLVLCQVGML